MKRIDSLEEFNIPEGLFPDEELFFIKNYLIRATRLLEGIPIDEINTLFQDLEEIQTNLSEAFEDQNAVDQFTDALKSQGKESNYSEQEIITLKLLDPEFFSDKDVWEKTPNMHDELSSKVEHSQKFYAVAALSHFSDAIKEAKKIDKTNDTNNNPYYRLGKSVKYIFWMELMLSLADSIKQEHIAIGKRETATKNIKKRIAKKGGDSAHTHKKQVKRELIKDYIEAKKSNKKIIKSKFIDDFIENLPHEKRRYFAKTNILRNLSDTLRDFDKGRISANIWPIPEGE